MRVSLLGLDNREVYPSSRTFHREDLSEPIVGLPLAVERGQGLYGVRYTIATAYALAFARHLDRGGSDPTRPSASDARGAPLGASPWRRITIRVFSSRKPRSRPRPVPAERHLRGRHDGAGPGAYALIVTVYDLRSGRSPPLAHFSAWDMGMASAVR